MVNYLVQSEIQETVHEELDEIAENEKNIWEELDDEDATHITTSLNRSSRQRLSCFAHSLQLFVGDGLSSDRPGALIGPFLN